MATNPETNKPMLGKAMAVIAAIFAVGGIGDGFYLLSQSQTANASLSFTVGVLLLLFSQFEHFESFKGFGIEAKVHQLDNKIQEADKINTALKSLTATLAQLAFEAMSRIGRWRGPIARKEGLEIEEALLQQMRDANIADAEIDRAVLPLRLIASFDILQPAINEVEERLKSWESEAQKRFSAVHQPINMSDPAYLGAKSELDRLGKMRKRLQDVRALGYGTKQGEGLRKLAADMQLNAETADYVPSQIFNRVLDDHAHYVKTGKHRDIERWIAEETE